MGLATSLNPIFHIMISPILQSIQLKKALSTSPVKISCHLHSFGVESETQEKWQLTIWLAL